MISCLVHSDGIFGIHLLYPVEVFFSRGLFPNFRTFYYSCFDFHLDDGFVSLALTGCLILISRYIQGMDPVHPFLMLVHPLLVTSSPPPFCDAGTPIF